MVKLSKVTSSCILQEKYIPVLKKRIQKRGLVVLFSGILVQAAGDSGFALIIRFIHLAVLDLTMTSFTYLV